MADIRIGIGGWNFAPWRGTFYPRGLPHAQELAYASTHLTSIEINGTFYRHQSPQTFAAWRDETPENFVFAVKAHRATTHGKDFAGAEAAIERFLNSGLAELGPKLGPVLWQFPPTRRFTQAACETFLQALPKSLNGHPLRHAIEARHASFEDPAWIALLRAHTGAAVIVDSEKQSLRGDLTADFIYARLQRNEAAAPEGYASANLNAWASRLKNWSTARPVSDLPLTAPNPEKPKNRDCYAYFIGGEKEHAPQAAEAMIARLSGTRLMPNLPHDIEAALAATPAAQHRFETLPPSHKAEYLTWIAEAKKEPTRQRRIAAMIEKLLEKDRRTGP